MRAGLGAPSPARSCPAGLQRTRGGSASPGPTRGAFTRSRPQPRSVSCSLGLADRSCSGIPWPELEDARGARGSEPRLALRWKSLKRCRNISVKVLPRAVQRSNNNGAIKERRKEAKCIVLKIRLQIGKKKKIHDKAQCDRVFFLLLLSHLIIFIFFLFGGFFEALTLVPESGLKLPVGNF